MEQVRHEIPPLYDAHAKILILGSFPSVKSREGHFFYNHPQNRFWRVLAAVTGEETPGSIPEKRAFLLRNGIALWDVIASCEIQGSSDSSIRNVVPNDIRPILETADIRQIYVNGGTAEKLYKKYIFPVTGRTAVRLPSTSPANAACSLEKLMEQWKTVNTYL
ncbi:DNA-deoxyinosine glycosylase [Anaerosacchariphilus sp. NSJ-68]|uniref:DNA-deoxyinosine glycosylase n=2 Tax=Lachnospiraceae TaxID=186803 RepID=A0A923LAV7_9FIRM|nr:MULTISPECIES: DNA-deoxyinosine glycosylase [Lachnospiraceae]MBC5658917.1 DNA-deoxyinosine glycosylase [Anaerosacchariphilus hominis]MBC5698814.1 DNA-deoxyinosine glycosylase [Roseburia difficilis]